MVVGDKRAGLSVAEAADLLRFSYTNIRRIYREGSKREKMSVGFLGKNALFMSKVTGEDQTALS